MLDVGKYNKLKIVEKSKDGVCLDGGTYGVLFLPAREVPAKCRVGETVEVFLYYDADKELVPTTQHPYAAVGEFALLEVVHVRDIGAFLDWGLPKDIFVPIREQAEIMDEGEPYVVYIYKDDERNHVAASSKLEKFLDKEPSAYQENDPVDLLIYQETDVGFKAVIDEKYSGLLYRNEVFQELKKGQRVKGFIKKIRDDGKIDLSLQVQGYHQMDDLEQKIMQEIEKNNGKLTITDKSSPDVISKTFGVSKKKYKMALGSLYKAQRISIEADGVKIRK